MSKKLNWDKLLGRKPKSTREWSLSKEKRYLLRRLQTTDPLDDEYGTILSRLKVIEETLRTETERQEHRHDGVLNMISTTAKIVVPGAALWCAFGADHGDRLPRKNSSDMLKKLL